MRAAGTRRSEPFTKPPRRRGRRFRLALAAWGIAALSALALFAVELAGGPKMPQRVAGPFSMVVMVWWHSPALLAYQAGGAGGSMLLEAFDVRTGRTRDLAHLPDGKLDRLFKEGAAVSMGGRPAHVLPLPLAPCPTVDRAVPAGYRSGVRCISVVQGGACAAWVSECTRPAICALLPAVLRSHTPCGRRSWAIWVQRRGWRSPRCLLRLSRWTELETNWDPQLVVSPRADYLAFAYRSSLYVAPVPRRDR